MSPYDMNPVGARHNRAADYVVARGTSAGRRRHMAGFRGSGCLAGADLGGRQRHLTWVIAVVIARMTGKRQVKRH